MSLPFFATGDPLTADDANTLARQGVIPVPDIATRNAIPAPHEGMEVFVESDKTYYGRVSGAWVRLGPPSRTVLTPAAGWSGYGGSFGSDLVGYATGSEVRLQGLARRTGSTISGSNTYTVIPALPTELRPPQTVVLAASIGQTSVGRVNVTAAGVVEVVLLSGQSIATDGFVSLSGLTWART